MFCDANFVQAVLPDDIVVCRIMMSSVSLASNANLLATKVSEIQHDSIGCFVSEDLKQPDHQSAANESKLEDTFKGSAIFMEVLFTDWVLIFIFAVVTKAFSF